MCTDAITFFNVSSEALKPLDKLVSKIKDNLGNSEVLKETSIEIKSFIDHLLSNANISDVSMLTEEIECIGCGGTSSCYRTCNTDKIKKIIKVFDPYTKFFAEGSKVYIEGQKTVDEKIINIGYNWIADKDDIIDDRESFLRRFVRFIEQRDEISHYIKLANETEENAFVVPELKLSSKGLVYVVDNFYGSTLQEKFDALRPKYHLVKEEDKKQNILNVIRFVREAAEAVYKFCHANEVFHGDIKLENFLKIHTDKEKKDKYFIRAIDFDTWTSKEKIESGYLEDFSASTPLFYSRIYVHQEFDRLIEYDVSALANMLMYGISLVVGDDPCIEYDKDSRRFNWWLYFFKSENCPAEKVFTVLNYQSKTVDKRNDLGGVYIFELLRDVLRRVVNCSSKKAIKILNNRDNNPETFIGYLLSIENLLEADLSGNRPEIIDEKALRYLGLLQIDRGICESCLQYSSYKNPLKDFVRLALQEGFVKKG